MDLPFTMPANSTLNEKFNVQQNVLPDIDTIPSMQYWAIGNGGHALSVGVGGATKTSPVQHRATDAALFSHLPFVLRELTNDLSPAERAKYAMRRQETHGGLQYAAYYLRRMDFTAVVPAMLNVHVEEGVKTTSAFVPTSSNLNPTPPDLSPEGVNLVSGDFASASAQLNLSFTAEELTDFIDAVKVLYDGDDGYAIVSEVALVSGLDKVVPSPAAGNTTINFNEVIAAQVVSFINTFFAAPYSNNSVGVVLDVGATEPLLSVTAS